eukprot:m51a1_g14493 putative 3 -cyclic-nucleotide phosphodiesterase rega (2308) ;mRNA; f:746776-765968
MADPVEPTAAPADASKPAGPPEPDAASVARALELKNAGNASYAGGDYAGAAELYSQALGELGLDPADPRVTADAPAARDAAVLLSNRAACWVGLARSDDAVKDCSKALEANPVYEKARWRRAGAYEALGKAREASEDYARLAKEAHDEAGRARAQDAVRRLEPAVKAQQQKEMDEMLGKLKELGNGLLGKFGLSTDNFKFDKDPNTGPADVELGALESARRVSLLLRPLAHTAGNVAGALEALDGAGLSDATQRLAGLACHSGAEPFLSSAGRLNSSVFYVSLAAAASSPQPPLPSSGGASCACRAEWLAFCNASAGAAVRALLGGPQMPCDRACEVLWGLRLSALLDPVVRPLQSPGAGPPLALSLRFTRGNGSARADWGRVWALAPGASASASCCAGNSQSALVYPRAAALDRTPRWSRAHAVAQEPCPVVTLGVPLYNAAGEHMGGVYLDLSLDSAAEQVVDALGPLDAYKGHSLVVAPDGQVLFHSDGAVAALFGAAQCPGVVCDVSDINCSLQLDTSAAQHCVLRDSEGSRSFLVVHHPIAAVNWTLVAFVPESQLEASSSHALAIILGVVLPVVAVAPAVAALVVLVRCVRSRVRVVAGGEEGALQSSIGTVAQDVIKKLMALKDRRGVTPEDRIELKKIVALIASTDIFKDVDLKRRLSQLQVETDVGDYLVDFLVSTGAEGELSSSLKQAIGQLPSKSPAPAPGAAAQREVSAAEIEVEEIIEFARHRLLVVLDGREVTINSWEFDVGQIPLPEGHSLFEVIGVALLNELDIISMYKFPRCKLYAFLQALDRGYNDVPFHNSAHAADVAQAMHYLVSACTVISFTPLERLAAVVAALAHDYGHPGVNNNYLQATLDPLYIQYNGSSVLESMHSSEAMKLLFARDNNFVAGRMLNEEVAELHRLVSQMILATDMSRHLEITSKFAARVSSGMLDAANKADRLLVLQMLIKMADVSNPARRWDICFRWANKVSDEFFDQGDKERSKGLTVSPFMDRASTELHKCQSAFIQFVVQPMLELVVRVCPATEITLGAHLAANADRWRGYSAHALPWLSKTMTKRGKNSSLSGKRPRSTEPNGMPPGETVLDRLLLIVPFLSTVALCAYSQTCKAIHAKCLQETERRKEVRLQGDGGKRIIRLHVTNSMELFVMHDPRPLLRKALRDNFEHYIVESVNELGGPDRCRIEVLLLDGNNAGMIPMALQNWFKYREQQKRHELHAMFTRGLVTLRVSQEALPGAAPAQNITQPPACSAILDLKGGKPAVLPAASGNLWPCVCRGAALLRRQGVARLAIGLSNVPEQTGGGHRKRQKKHELCEMITSGIKWLLVCTLILVLLLLAATEFGRLTRFAKDHSPLVDIGVQWLTIAGWIALWEPITLFLHSWRPVRADIVAFRGIQHVTKVVEYPGAPMGPPLLLPPSPRRVPPGSVDLLEELAIAKEAAESRAEGLARQLEAARGESEGLRSLLARLSDAAARDSAERAAALDQRAGECERLREQVAQLMASADELRGAERAVEKLAERCASLEDERDSAKEEVRALRELKAAAEALEAEQAAEIKRLADDLDRARSVAEASALDARQSRERADVAERLCAQLATALRETQRTPPEQPQAPAGSSGAPAGHGADAEARLARAEARAGVCQALRGAARAEARTWSDLSRGVFGGSALAPAEEGARLALAAARCGSECRAAREAVCACASRKESAVPWEFAAELAAAEAALAAVAFALRSRCCADAATWPPGTPPGCAGAVASAEATVDAACAVVASDGVPEPEALAPLLAPLRAACAELRGVLPGGPADVCDAEGRARAAELACRTRAACIASGAGSESELIPWDLVEVVRSVLAQYDRSSLPADDWRAAVGVFAALSDAAQKLLAGFACADDAADDSAALQSDATWEESAGQFVKEVHDALNALAAPAQQPQRPRPQSPGSQWLEGVHRTRDALFAEPNSLRQRASDAEKERAEAQRALSVAEVRLDDRRRMEESLLARVSLLQQTTDEQREQLKKMREALRSQEQSFEAELDRLRAANQHREQLAASHHARSSSFSFSRLSAASSSSSSSQQSPSPLSASSGPVAAAPVTPQMQLSLARLAVSSLSVQPALLSPTAAQAASMPGLSLPVPAQQQQPATGQTTPPVTPRPEKALKAEARELSLSLQHAELENASLRAQLADVLARDIARLCDTGARDDYALPPASPGSREISKAVSAVAEAGRAAALEAAGARVVSLRDKAAWAEGAQLLRAQANVSAARASSIVSAVECARDVALVGVVRVPSAAPTTAAPTPVLMTREQLRALHASLLFV